MKIDFSNYPLSDIQYGGSEKKLGILIDGIPYMLKFQKKTPFGKRNNHISIKQKSFTLITVGYIGQLGW